MTGSIICGVDDSESATGAERVARALAGELGLGLVFVGVLEPNASDAKLSAITTRLEQLSAHASDVRPAARTGWSRLAILPTASSPLRRTPTRR